MICRGFPKGTQHNFIALARRGFAVYVANIAFTPQPEFPRLFTGRERGHWLVAIMRMMPVVNRRMGITGDSAGGCILARLQSNPTFRIVDQENYWG